MITTEAVIINWKRPRNVAKIVAALKAQSTPCTVTVCDCHLSPEFALDALTLSLIDRRYRWEHNTGAFSRYVPFGAYDHEYTLFLDDDMLPGLRCVEHFVSCAERIGEFGVLGQQGSPIMPDLVYRPIDHVREKNFSQTDIVVRGYFVRTRNLHYIHQFRWKMDYFDDVLEDDLLLCISLRVCAGLGSYMTPWDDDPETLMNKRELSYEHALFMRPDHQQRRTDFLRRATNFGWQPVQAV